MVLLRSIAKGNGFLPDLFAMDWQDFWERDTSKAYVDMATRTTLLNLQSGLPYHNAASASKELAGAGRVAPLFLLKWKNPAHLVAAAGEQAAITHGDPIAVESSEFFAALAISVADGLRIAEALERTVGQGTWGEQLAGYYESGKRTAESDVDPKVAVKKHGQACNVENAFPVVCDLLLRYPDDPVQGLCMNAQIGGDSAARALVLGLVYGAMPDLPELPAKWYDELLAIEEIEGLIDKIMKDGA